MRRPPARRTAGELVARICRTLRGSRAHAAGREVPRRAQLRPADRESKAASDHVMGVDLRRCGHQPCRSVWFRHPSGMTKLFRPPLNQRVASSGTTGRRAAVTVSARRSPTHGGTTCQESVVGWPGDLLCVNGLGVRTACWLSSQVPVSCRRAAVGQAVAPVRARARTNELDAGKRRPMIGGEEEPAGLWLRGRGGFARWFPGCVRRSGGVVSQPPIRPPRGAGP
jgi:hypothetical protein